MKCVPRYCLGLVLSLLAPAWSQSAVVTLGPSADAGLIGKLPDNNTGGNRNFIAGTVATGENARSLIRFDLAGRIAPGSIIDSVSLQLNLAAAGSGSGSEFGLHRMLVGWEEGIGNFNGGQPAGTGESTWNHRGHPSTPWGTPGGQPGVDYASDPSATQYMDRIGVYTFSPASGLVSDVRGWLEDPLANHGWIMISRSEGDPGTSRRFASREDAGLAPSLTVTFTPPPVFRITGVTRDGGDLNFTWAGGSGPYQVQFRPSLGQPWTHWGAPTLDTFGRVPLAGCEGYVRVVAEQTARYQLVFAAQWTPSTHPDQYPGGPHFSGLVGGTHRGEGIFWRTNQPASTGIKNMAELGSKTAFIAEVEAAIADGRAEYVLSGGGIGSGTGLVTLDFSVSRDHPRVTVVSMLAPSPDWFVGVDGLNLLEEEGRWLDSVMVRLYLYDAGTDSGPSYASPNQVTAPFEAIRQIDGFPALVGEGLVPFGTFTFERVDGGGGL